jgi:hypothetical protein
LGIVAKVTDGHEDSVDLFQPWGPTALSTRSEHVDASDAMLPDCPFCVELGNTGINTRIGGALASGVNPKFGLGLYP